jgi:hypothetical protein
MLVVVVPEDIVVVGVVIMVDAFQMVKFPQGQTDFAFIVGVNSLIKAS